MIDASRSPIHLVDSEAERLGDLALAAEAHFPEVAELLLTEIERSTVHEAEAFPDRTVRMGARVDFVDEGSGARRTVELVYPPDADVDAGKLSILSLIGAGIIGLGEGQTIRWPDRSGAERVLRIEKVTPPAA
ncbi:GreA/GreB family elongation factor [Sphingosinicella soli]|uniref:Regulator of nucleoside diphosphate kinase n=1 Tax=Sphingosinicella soli TaxID=333708 RepID=A0A7W7B317_9SPHN|nr:GreA/GreB family elongation factor [Sphingosinicella soli]MBB4633073.1 regulator of nucleoside diphosphate kinase [Sphingosinicella soli]